MRAPLGAARKMRWLLALTYLLAVALLIQGVLGGFMLDGAGWAGTWHGRIGEALPVIALVQTVLAFLSVRADAPAWLLGAAGGLLLTTLGLVLLGMFGPMALHVPLSFVSFALAVVLIGGLRRGRLKLSPDGL